jgi:Ala-tRNA(Pro) deacylase
MIITTRPGSNRGHGPWQLQREATTMTIVTDHLERLGVRFEVLPHERSETALEEAKALDINPDEVLKVLVLDVETGHALAVLPASRRLDVDLVREALDDRRATLASEKEIADVFPEFEPGALPALPSLLHVPVVLDPRVLAHRKVTFAAGIQRESVRLESDRLLRGATVTIAPISRSSSPSTEEETGTSPRTLSAGRG